ncbi:unnamed protein product [Schistosoma curassoni]|uniref:HTH psq-type domain-containing protein n=1 Tax=Schistosoma curassoni TaxID=6186 RepID=A0A183JUS2_9TREM|nr:unnamed protein product [Schistosoma curassoni]
MFLFVETHIDDHSNQHTKDLSKSFNVNISTIKSIRTEQTPASASIASKKRI